MRLVYVGPFEEVEVAAWIDQRTGYPHEVRRGRAVDIPDEIARRLLEQADNWERSEPPARGGGKTEPTPAEE